MISPKLLLHTYFTFNFIHLIHNYQFFIVVIVISCSLFQSDRINRLLQYSSFKSKLIIKNSSFNLNKILLMRETIEVLGGATFVPLTFGHMCLHDFSSTNNKKRHLCHLVETRGQKDGQMYRRTDGQTDRWDRSGGQGAKPSVRR